MMFEQSLYDRLKVALSADVATRIYPLVAPEKFTAPLAVYQTVSDTPEHTLDGATNYHRIGVQVDVYSKDYAVAKSMARKVALSLTSWTLPDAVSVEDAIDLIEDTVTPNLYRVSMRFLIEHTDTD